MYPAGSAVDVICFERIYTRTTFHNYRKYIDNRVTCETAVHSWNHRDDSCKLLDIWNLLTLSESLRPHDSCILLKKLFFECCSYPWVMFSVFQVASLLHDDVLDDADTRRGIGSLNFVMGNKVPVTLMHIPWYSHIYWCMWVILDILSIHDVDAWSCIKGHVYSYWKDFYICLPSPCCIWEIHPLCYWKIAGEVWRSTYWIWCILMPLSKDNWLPS